MNKIETHPKVKELKKVWAENREKMSTHAIWREFVEKYFKPTDMFIFYKTVSKWEKEVDKEKAEKMTPEEVEKLNEENRKIAILTLNRILKNYQRNPRAYKNINIKEISRLYAIIRSAEEASRRTEIAAHKEKRETVRTLLPYQRMSIEELLELKDRVIASFDRIVEHRKQLKSGKKQELQISK